MYRGHLLYLSQPGKGAADLYALLHHITKISCQFYSSTCPSLFGFLIIEVWGDAIVTFDAPGREFLYKGWSRPWMSRQDQEPLPQADKGIVCHWKSIAIGRQCNVCIHKVWQYISKVVSPREHWLSNKVLKVPFRHINRLLLVMHHLYWLWRTAKGEELE